MGKMQRTKGHSFERRIAADLRALWPGADVHRSSQADRARNSDVVIEGEVPALVKQLWLELQDAAKPMPLAKLAQAERDIDASMQSKRAVIVWHKLRERSINVTMRYWALFELISWTELLYHSAPEHETVVTLDWLAFCAIIKAMPTVARAKEQAA